MRATLSIVLSICAALAPAACKRAPSTDPNTRVYEVRGIVRGFAPDRSTVDIQHEEIPGFMPSMTMPFTVKEQKEITGLKSATPFPSA